MLAKRRVRVCVLLLLLLSLAVFGNSLHGGFLTVARAAPSEQDQVAYVSQREGSTQIYVVGADGSGDKRLTAPPGDNFSPVWSPDGQRIAFTSTRDGPGQIYVMNADGTGQQKLTSLAGGVTTLAWSPDGRRITFAAFREGNALIQVMNVDGTGQVELTPPPGENIAPSWSPDGRFIAFVARRGNPDPNPYLMNADGSGQRRLADLGILLLPGAMELVWSPDSRRIYMGDPAMAGVVAISVLDGSQTKLAPGYAPNIARDGRIAFVSSGAINTMNPDGSGRRALTAGFLPVWSPDGGRIAFVNVDFFVISAQGGQPIRVARGPANLRVGPFITWRPR